jgi:hypothetical protein
VTEIPPGSAPKIKDRIRRVALYRAEECRVVLVDYEESGENAIFHGVPPPSCF